jgi:hypothetical protein
MFMFWDIIITETLVLAFLSKGFTYHVFEIPRKYYSDPALDF